MADLPHYDLDPVAQDIFDLMRRQPGDVFSPGELARTLAYPEPAIGAALHQLTELGFVDKAAGAQEAYILSPGAPEL